MWRDMLSFHHVGSLLMYHIIFNTAVAMEPVSPEAKRAGVLERRKDAPICQKHPEFDLCQSGIPITLPITANATNLVIPVAQVTTYTQSIELETITGRPVIHVSTVTQAGHATLITDAAPTRPVINVTTITHPRMVTTVMATKTVDDLFAIINSTVTATISQTVVAGVAQSFAVAPFLIPFLKMAIQLIVEGKKSGDDKSYMTVADIKDEVLQKVKAFALKYGIEVTNEQLRNILRAFVPFAVTVGLTVGIYRTYFNNPDSGILHLPGLANQHYASPHAPDPPKPPENSAGDQPTVKHTEANTQDMQTRTGAASETFTSSSSGKCKKCSCYKTLDTPTITWVPMTLPSDLRPSIRTTLPSSLRPTTSTLKTSTKVTSTTTKTTRTTTAGPTPSLVQRDVCGKDVLFPKVQKVKPLSYIDETFRIQLEGACQTFELDHGKTRTEDLAKGGIHWTKGWQGGTSFPNSTGLYRLLPPKSPNQSWMIYLRKNSECVPKGQVRKQDCVDAFFHILDTCVTKEGAAIGGDIYHKISYGGVHYSDCLQYTVARHYYPDLFAFDKADGDKIPPDFRDAFKILTNLCYEEQYNDPIAKNDDCLKVTYDKSNKDQGEYDFKLGMLPGQADELIVTIEGFGAIPASEFTNVEMLLGGLGKGYGEENGQHQLHANELVPTNGMHRIGGH